MAMTCQHNILEVQCYSPPEHDHFSQKGNTVPTYLQWFDQYITIHYRYSKSVNRTLCISSCGPESAPTTMYDRCTVQLKWRWIDVPPKKQPSNVLGEIWPTLRYPQASAAILKNQGWIWKAPRLNTSKTSFFGPKMYQARKKDLSERGPLDRGPEGSMSNSFGTWRADQPDTPTPVSTAKRQPLNLAKLPESDNTIAWDN